MEVKIFHSAVIPNLPVWVLLYNYIVGIGADSDILLDKRFRAGFIEDVEEKYSILLKDNTVCNAITRLREIGVLIPDEDRGYYKIAEYE